MKKILISFYYAPYILFARFLFLFSSVKVGSGFQIHGLLFLKNKGELVFGNHVRINSSFGSNPIGGASRTSIQIARGAYLSIGDYTGISNCSIYSAKSICIGKNVLFGAGCLIADTDFHSIDSSMRLRGKESVSDVKSRPISIEDNVFIGARCIILKGVTVGSRSILGAGSVLRCSIPPGEIWAGNPAVFIRKI